MAHLAARLQSGECVAARSVGHLSRLVRCSLRRKLTPPGDRFEGFINTEFHCFVSGVETIQSEESCRKHADVIDNKGD